MIVFVHGVVQVPRGGAVRKTLGDDAWVPDLPGYGENAAMPEVSLDAAVRFLAHRMAGWGGPAAVAGHSIGGAIAWLLAHRHPELVRAVISIEGNFTPKDAFWTHQMAEQPLSATAAQLAEWRGNPGAWLAGQGIAVSPERVALALDGLEAQSAETVRAMARSTVAVTFAPEYLDIVGDVVARTPVHLVAGERSANSWDVPAFVRAKATSDTIVPGVGHLLWVEDPAAAGDAVRHAAR